MMLDITTLMMMKILEEFDDSRTIGSITKAEVKEILKDKMDKVL